MDLTLPFAHIFALMYEQSEHQFFLTMSMSKSELQVFRVFKIYDTVGYFAASLE
jgi:hypothetical protein